MLAEELDAIRAIYSNKDEFDVLYKGDGVQDTIVKVQVACDAVSPPTRLTVVFTLAPDYPSISPDISLFCDQMKREQAELFKEAVLTYARSHTGEPVIMDIVLWIQNNITRYIDHNKGKSAQQNASIITALLHIDHMRARGKYIKTIQKWTDDLNLAGRLIFHGSLIFLLLLGNREDIKEYIVRMKTVNIDVDSKGRSCKERMMKVVAEEELDNPDKRISSFEVIEATSLDDVHNIFTAAFLEPIFKQHILPFYKKS